MVDFATLTEQSRCNAAIEAEEMTLIATLNPRIFIDGNQWCVLYGKNLQDGVAGFGDTPRQAAYAFNKAWDKPLPSRKPKEQIMAGFDDAIDALKQPSVCSEEPK